MTLDELADLSAEKLEAMDDKELTAILSPYFNVTRPELAPRPQAKASPSVDPAVRQGVEKLAALGIDMSYLLKRKKR